MCHIIQGSPERLVEELLGVVATFYEEAALEKGLEEAYLFELEVDAVVTSLNIVWEPAQVDGPFGEFLSAPLRREGVARACESRSEKPFFTLECYLLAEKFAALAQQLLLGTLKFGQGRSASLRIQIRAAMVLSFEAITVMH